MTLTCSIQQGLTFGQLAVVEIVFRAPLASV